MPAFSNGDNYDSLAASDQTDSGSALDSITSAVSALGVAAITTFGPKNAGIATNQGTLQPGLSAYTPSAGSSALIFVAVLALIGVFVYKKL